MGQRLVGTALIAVAAVLCVGFGVAEHSARSNAALIAWKALSSERRSAVMRAVKLTPHTTPSGRFGISVAVSGDTVVVGAIVGKHDRRPVRGEVFVFERPRAGWTASVRPAAVLRTSFNGPSVLGAAVAISGRTIVASDPAQPTGAYAAYGVLDVYSEPVGGWRDMTQTAQLTITDETVDQRLARRPGALAIAGRTIIAASGGFLGSSEPVAIFIEPPGGWRNATQTAEIAADHPGFGDAIALSTDTLVVAADGPIHGRGVLDVYAAGASGWTHPVHRAMLTERGGPRDNLLGTAVAIAGDTIIATSSYTHGHVVDLYARPAGGWRTATQSATLSETRPRAGDGFGAALAFSGTTIVASAPGRRVHRNEPYGGLLLFARPVAGWHNATETLQVPSPVNQQGEFGPPLTATNTTILVGMPNGSGTSRAYLFGTQQPTSP